MYIKWLKRIVFIIGTVTLLTLLAAVYAGYHYRGAIVPVITSELNSRLKTPVHVDTIRVTFLKNFPNASVHFEGVTAMSSDQTQPNDTLFHLEKLYLSFNLTDLYNGNFTLSQIDAENGFVNMRVNANGVSNFEFYETGDESERTQNFKTALNKIVLKNIGYRFRDVQGNSMYDFYVVNLTGKGDFTGGESHIAMYGNVNNNKVVVDDISYLPGENIKPDVAVEMNPGTGFFQISRGIIKVRDKHRFEVKGKHTGDHSFEWRFKGENLDFDAVKTLTPEVWAQSFNTIKAAGQLEFKGRVKREGAGGMTEFSSDFELKKGKLDFPEHHIHAKNLYLRGNYTRNAGAHKTGTLSVDSLTCKLNGGDFYGRIYAKNPQALDFKVYLSHQNELSSFKNAIVADTLSALNGSFDVSGYLSGRIIPGDSFTFEHFAAFGKELDVRLNRGEVKIKNSPFHASQLSSGVRVVNNDIFIDSLSALFMDDPTLIRGTWRNAFGFMTQKDKLFRFFGSAEMENFNFQKVFPDDDTQASQPFALPDNLLVDITSFSVSRFNYNNLFIEDVKGSFLVRPGRLNFERLSGNVAGGAVKGEAVLTDNPAKADFKGEAEHIDITTLFEAFNDFGSEDLGARNVRGKLDMDFNVMLPLNKAGSPDYDFMAGVVDFEIHNGELIDYKPLQQTTAVVRENKILNLFIKLDAFEERLKHIEFETLANTLKVREGVIYIPDMKIYSSALDIEVGGEQHFNGTIDYMLNFNIKQVLQKGEVKETEYGYIEDDGKGGKIIYLLVSGTVDHPVVKLDKIRSQRRMKEDIKKEIKMTKAVLKEDFGLFKGDTSLPDIKEPVKQDMRFEFDADKNVGDDDAEVEEGSDQKQDTTKNKVKRFFQKVKGKTGGEDSKDGDFDDWSFDDDDF